MTSFFIGIRLPPQLEEEVESLRRRFRAPKTPPHITLIPPFQWEGDYRRLFDDLCDVAGKMPPFTIKAAGLGHFGTGVIFIDVKSSKELTECYDSLHQRLEQEEGASLPPLRPYHPHITLATRLGREQFNTYWQELGGYDPQTEFTCQSLSLFQLFQRGRVRHWEVVREFKLNG